MKRNLFIGMALAVICSGAVILSGCEKENAVVPAVKNAETAVTENGRLTQQPVKVTRKQQTSAATMKITGTQEPATQAVFKPTTLKKIREDQRFKYYSGTVRLSGNYVLYAEDMAFMGGRLCFNADNETGYLIPRNEIDTRPPWFCFNDQEKAKRLLGLTSPPKGSESCLGGAATISVTNYVVDTMESEVTDLADLVKIISKKKTELLEGQACWGE